LDYGDEMVVYHIPTYTDVNIDMSIGVNVDPALRLPPNSEAAGITRRQLLAAPLAASSIHHGPLPEIAEVVSNLYRWLGTNGYASAGPYREIHLFGRELDLYKGDQIPNAVLEIQIPIEKF
jgi:effector-binding domain-containing protein